MKKFIRGTVGILTTLAMATTVAFTSVAAVESEDTVFYQDFSTVEEANVIANNNISTLVGLSSVVLDNENYSVTMMKRNASPNNAPTSDFDLSEGSIHFVNNSENEKDTTATTGGFDIWRTFIDFGDGYAVDSSVDKNLFIEFDIQINDVVYGSAQTDEYINRNILGAIYKYDKTAQNFPASTMTSSMAASNNAANYGLEIQSVRNSETGLTEKVGLGIRGPVGNGHVIAKQTTAVLNSTNGSNAGVFLADKGTVFHVVYKINPATTANNTSVTGVNGSQFAKIESVTFSYDEYTATMKPNADRWNSYNYVLREADSSYYKSADRIDGISFLRFPGVDYSIDNLAVYYEADEDAVLTASAAEGSENWSKRLPLEVSFNGCIKPTLLDVDDTLEIVVKKNGADITDEVDFDWILGSTSKLEISVDDVSYFETYTISIPAGIKTINGIETEDQELTYITETAPRVDVLMTAKVDGETVTSLDGLGGKYIVCSSTATPLDASTAMMVIGLYDEEGLVKISAQNIAFIVGQSENMIFEFKLPDDVENYQIKAFVCEGLDSLIPFGASSIIE